ncbi:solute carrier family 22 member 1-like [Glandiceps talaboti]
MAVTLCRNGWSIGSAIVGVISIGCHGDWRKIQLVIALTSLIYIPYYWLIKESPRWLIQKERTEEASKIILEIARWNNKTYECELDMPQNCENGKQVDNASREVIENASTERIGEIIGSTMIDIFRSPELRKYTINMCFYMFTAGIMYGGVSFNSNYFSSEIYTLYMLSCLVEIPANLLALWLFKYMPRRWMLCTTMTLTGATWISSAFIGIRICQMTIFEDIVRLVGNAILNIIIITVAKMCETVAYITAATVSTEIYPTTLRSRSKEKNNERRSLLNDSQ